MALGYLNINYDSIVLPYNDEKTPVDLCEKKMLPIFSWGPDDQSNESLDIIKRLDTDNVLKNNLLEDEEKLGEIEELLSSIGSPTHNLAMPYWIWLPEFNVESRQYFVEKKSQKRGPFHVLAQKRPVYLKEIEPVLKRVQAHLHPFYLGEQLSIFDIMLASHLWGLYVVPEFQFSSQMHSYLQTVKRLCQFDYLNDLWTRQNFLK